MVRRLRWLGLVVAISGTGAWADYSDHPELKLSELTSQLEAFGYTQSELVDIFRAAEKKQSIIDAISRPAEKVLAWHEYQNIFLTERRIKEGLEFMRAHQETLARAERELGVPAEVMAAIIGVETYYGRIAGSYRVIDALSTLAFDYPKRSTFFRKQLVEYLQLAKEQKINPLEPKGSYAGAMGFGQFMPSSYRAYAIDFDGDDFVDIWNNEADAIGSVGHYLKRHGWKTGQPITLPLKKEQFLASEWLTDDLKLSYTIAELPADAAALVSSSLPSDSLIEPIEMETEVGPQQWLVFNNFYAITRYNHSRMYAMAVTELSEALAAGLREQ